MRIESVAQFEAFRREAASRREARKREVLVCCGTGCLAHGSAKVAEALGVPLAKVFSVATFYKAFSLTPQGRTIIRVCTGTACHIRGAEQLIEELERKLGIKPGETTADMGFTVKTVNCVGACAMAPVLIVGEKYQGGAKAARMTQYLGLPAKDAAAAGASDATNDDEEAADAH